MSKAVQNVFAKAIRETGQALDRLACTVAGKEVFKETFSRHRAVMPLFDMAPEVPVDAFVAPSATIVGDVTLGSGASVWFGAVVRADRGNISIGSKSNIQDRAVISGTSTVIGTGVTVGHGALLEGCTIGNGALVGQGAIVQEGSSVGSGSIVAAGAVVLPETVIPAGQLWVGNPATFKKNVTDGDMKTYDAICEKYAKLAQTYSS